MGHVPERTQLSSSRFIDLWEHACFLYHNFDWQSAAEAFGDLLLFATDPKERSLLALNRGLIEARLGDLIPALGSFLEAQRSDNDDPLTSFLLGLVKVEIGDYASGLVCFKSTLEKLQSDDLDCHSRGLAFILRASDARDNADQMHIMCEAIAAKGHRVEIVCPGLNRIPADILFEAPSRIKEKSVAIDHTLEAKSCNSSGSASVVSAPMKNSSRDGAALTGSSRVTSQAFLTIRIPSQLQVNDNKIEPLGDHDEHEGLASGFIPNQPPANRPSKNLAPRDPQVRDESTRDLARFLRHAGPGGSQNVTVDRQYMLRLLQGHGDRSPAAYERDLAVNTNYDMATLGPTNGNATDDLESLINLYCGSMLNRRSAPETTMESIQKPLADSSSLFFDEYTIRRENIAHAESITGGIARKPIPNSGSVPSFQEPAYPVAREALTEQHNPNSLETYEEPTKRSRRARRPTLEKAKRWLRKEIKPPWSLRDETHDRESTDSSQSGSDSTASSEKQRGKKSVPSTVSSTEIFRYGIPRRALRSR